jgi:predicted RNase H-like nuclease (RuvC/YqgF family)
METEMVKDGGAAGLVERLRGLSKSLQGLDWCDSLVPDEAADALEMKIEMINQLASRVNEARAAPKKLHYLIDELEAALEAKDALIKNYQEFIEAQAREIAQQRATWREFEQHEWAQAQAEIERLRKEVDARAFIISEFYRQAMERATEARTAP